jgi:hypothetical protein
LAPYVTSNSSRINENSARYLSVNTHDLASCVTSNHSRINENLSPYAKINGHNSASYVTPNSSQINEILSRHLSAKTRDSALYVALKSNRIDEDLSQTRHPYGSSKWKVPAYPRPYPLCIDYLKTPDGWWVLDFYEFSGKDDKTAMEHISIYLSQLGFVGKEDYQSAKFSLSLTGITFAWFTSLPRCTVGSWSQLEEQFYEYFGKTNEKRPITVESSAKRGLLVGMKERFDLDRSKVLAIKAKQRNILSESTTYQETNLATEKHEKRKKIARLDFSRSKRAVHLSSDYCIIDGDQAPTGNKGGLHACSESAEPTSKLAKLIAACPESARLTS